MWTKLFLALTLAFGVDSHSSAPNAAPQSPPPAAVSADIRAGIPSPQVPQAAADFLKLASDMNGLDVPSARPWHVKLAFDQFDEDGDNVHSGTLEEFHAGPGKYKRIYTSDTLSHTDIANGTGLFRVGDQSWPGVIETDILNAALYPLHQAHGDDRTRRPEKTESRFGSAKLPCITLHEKDTNVIHIGSPVFCFEPNTVMLRYVNANLAETITYNNIVPFQGHYVARDMDVAHLGKTFLKIHVEELGEIAQIADSFFSPPLDSKGPLGGRISVPSATYLDEYLLSQPMPVYPRGVDGKVNVNFVIGKDGRVIEATAGDGPDNVRKAVLDAVWKYRFRPYLILDQPVEVECSKSFELHSR